MIIKKFESFEYKKLEDTKELKDLISNARKFKKQDFINSYVSVYGVTTRLIYHNGIKKGDKVDLIIRRNKQEIPYKTIISDSFYSQWNIWNFILNNTKELQEEAAYLYEKNKNNKKPKLKSDNKIIAYHASPYKFDNFMYDMNKTSYQVGADVGFFFLTNKKDVERYADGIISDYGVCYIYKVYVKYDNVLELIGEEIGTLWGRYNELLQAEEEGYDCVLIKDADTGNAGIADEIVVFDDDNIETISVTKY